MSTFSGHRGEPLLFQKLTAFSQIESFLSLHHRPNSWDVEAVARPEQIIIVIRLVIEILRFVGFLNQRYTGCPDYLAPFHGDG